MCVSLVPTLHATVRRNVARRKALGKAALANAAAAVRGRVLEHIRVERSGLLLLLACVASIHSGFAGADDALFAASVKAPCLFRGAAGVAFVALVAANNEMLCCSTRVLDVTQWELLASEQCIADRTIHVSAALDAVLVARLKTVAV